MSLWDSPTWTDQNCTRQPGVGYLSPVNISQAYCSVANGNPRMGPCCAKYGDGVVHARPDECNTWCTLNSTDDGSGFIHPVRQNFSLCMVNGIDGNGPNIRSDIMCGYDRSNKTTSTTASPTASPTSSPSVSSSSSSSPSSSPTANAASFQSLKSAWFVGGLLAFAMLLPGF